jgi:hypothetical protein
MIKVSALIAYISYVMLFAVLFKYGIHISFKIDTGFVGPVFIYHSIMMFLLLTGQNRK